MTSFYPSTTVHTRNRHFAPPPLPFLTPSSPRGTRPKLSLNISNTDTCERYTPSKLPPCEFISPATRQNTFFNTNIESDESSEESSGGEEEDVVVARLRKGRKKSGSVRFVEAVDVRIISDEWAEEKL